MGYKRDGIHMDSLWSVPSCFCGFGNAWFGMLWESQVGSFLPMPILKTIENPWAQQPSFPKLRELFQNGRIPPSHPDMSWYVHLNFPSIFYIIYIYILMFYRNVLWNHTLSLPHRFPRLASPTLVPALPLLHKFVWPFAGPFCGRTDPDLSRSVDPRLGGRSRCREATGQLILK